MVDNPVVNQFIEHCQKGLFSNSKITNLLKKARIFERQILETFKIGYDDGTFQAKTRILDDSYSVSDSVDLFIKKRSAFTHCLIFPIFANNHQIANIVGYNPHPQCKNRFRSLNDDGVFNQVFLQYQSEIIFTSDPVQSLWFIQNGYPQSTYLFGGDDKYLRFFNKHNIQKVVFTFEGKAKLFYDLARQGYQPIRIPLDHVDFKKTGAKEKLHQLFNLDEHANYDDTTTDDTIQEIENGFLFRFPILSYRVIGNFSEYSFNMKANIKAFTDDDIFVDSIDLYKNRDRQNFIYNLIDKFDIRDQIQLENDLKQILEVIEKHKEKKEKAKKRTKPELTEYQKQIGLRLLKSPDLIDAIEKDYEKLGYVRERKNKILLYFVMTSRLMESPLHAIIISRSGAGKSQLAEITETLCPTEDVESISDLSAQALYYFGKNDLKHKFIVIGEKKGSEGSDYPLRELISRKSITKAIPMKDQATGQIKTTSITVNGPIALVETTTSGLVNPENLNRCYVISIDESEEQTALIHQAQRKNQTVSGFLESRNREPILQRHIYAQRLLKKINVFNPFAELLTFPSATLKSRRDNEKFLRLIRCSCFLHQYQRKVNKLKIDNNEIIDYIECTPEDYAIAYELLSDGVLDNTLDDLPRPARKLLDLIKKYLNEKSKRDNISIDKIIFERKEIRDYTSWSFAQVRNNFRTLKEYEYIKLIKVQNGLANQYKLTTHYSDLDFLHQILTPEELEKRYNDFKKRNPNKLNIPEYSGENLVTVS